jgi:3-deoxy-D-manno-octulosonate 8-phosphate phosphatase (KDO 8-P phosphatase)
LTLFEQNIAYLVERGKLVLDRPIAEYTLADIQSIALQSGYAMEHLMLFQLRAETLDWAQLKFVFLDVDGMLTEGGMFYTESGEEFKRFDTKDGMGIKVAMQHGIQFGIISSGVNPAIIARRASMFGIEHVYVGTAPKLTVAEEWLKKLDLNWEDCAYLGDDINDLAMMKHCGISACPSDATPLVRQASDFVLQSKGGYGCVREFLRHHPEFQSLL